MRDERESAGLFGIGRRARARWDARLTQTRKDALQVVLGDNTVTILVDQREGFFELLHLGGLEQRKHAGRFATYSCLRGLVE